MLKLSKVEVLFLRDSTNKINIVGKDAKFLAELQDKLDKEAEGLKKDGNNGLEQ